MKRTTFDRTVAVAALLAMALGSAGCDDAGDSHPVAGGHETHEPHDEHGDGGHDEHGGEGHDEHADGAVELSPQALAAASIVTAPAEERVLSEELETTGQVGYDEGRVVHVGPRISGRIHEVHADLGARVERGALLASLDSIELGQAKARYLQARARLVAAVQALERESALLADGISTEQQRIEAEAAERVARAEAEAARETLRLYGLDRAAIDGLGHGERESSHFPIRAPLGGTVVERHAAIGEYVTPERTLFRVADLGHLWIWIDVYERDLARVSVGDRVRVRVDAFPERGFEGEVSYLASEVAPDTRTIRARIDVANLDGLLRPGMFARVQLSGGLPSTSAVARVVVPVSAVQRMGDEQLVFVQESEGRFEAREVRTGTRGGDGVEILDGVRAGEHVVVEGGFVLKSELGKGAMGGGHSH